MSETNEVYKGSDFSVTRITYMDTSGSYLTMKECGPNIKKKISKKGKK